MKLRTSKVLLGLVALLGTAMASTVHAQDLIIGGAGLTVIPDGNVSGSVYDGTHFGPVTLGNSRVHSYVMTNTVESPDVLITGATTVTGPNAGDFTVENFQTEVWHGWYHSFFITFTPSGEGLRSATITVPNNTPGDKGSYSFQVWGEGISGSDFRPLNISARYAKTPKVKANKKTGLYKVSWSIEVLNEGSMAATEGTLVRFYRSDDDFLSVGDQLLSEVPLKSLAAAKETNNGVKTTRKRVKLKATVPQQSGFLIAVVVPQPGTEYENDVSNNYVTIPYPIF